MYCASFMVESAWKSSPSKDLEYVMWAEYCMYKLDAEYIYILCSHSYLFLEEMPSLANEDKADEITDMALYFGKVLFYTAQL